MEDFVKNLKERVADNLESAIYADDLVIIYDQSINEKVLSTLEEMEEEFEMKINKRKSAFFLINQPAAS